MQISHASNKIYDFSAEKCKIFLLKCVKFYC
jgi:hypothetical protein